VTTGEWRKAVEARMGRKMTRSERQCMGKAKLSKLLASIRAHNMQKFSRRYRAYRCRICGHWHVGRKGLG